MIVLGVGAGRHRHLHVPAHLPDGRHDAIRSVEMDMVGYARDMRKGSVEQRGPSEPRTESRRRPGRAAGFTLIELLVVITIIGDPGGGGDSPVRRLPAQGLRRRCPGQREEHGPGPGGLLRGQQHLHRRRRRPDGLRLQPEPQHHRGRHHRRRQHVRGHQPPSPPAAATAPASPPTTGPPATSPW